MEESVVLLQNKFHSWRIPGSRTTQNITFLIIPHFDIVFIYPHQDILSHTRMDKLSPLMANLKSLQARRLAFFQTQEQDDTITTKHEFERK